MDGLPAGCSPHRLSRPASYFSMHAVTAAASSRQPLSPAGALQPAPGQPFVVPVGAPPWAAAAFTQLAAMIAANTAATAANAAATAANTAAITANTANITANAAAIRMLMHRTSLDRAIALGWNRRANLPDDTLRPVPHPDTGAKPPPAFPMSVHDLRKLQSGPVNVLLHFYGMQPQGDLAERRHQLAEALGCGQSV